MNKRQRIFGVLVLVLLTGATFVAAHGEDDQDTVTVEGEILDLACYVANEAKGEGHAKCAEACIKGGQPMGLLASDGTVYVLYASHSNGEAFVEAKTFAGKKVEITGAATKRGGIHGLEVHAVKAI